MKNETSEFKLKDFYGACLIKSLGFPLLRLDRGSNKFVTFVFDDPDFMAEEMLGQYWDGQLEVNAKDLISNIKELKSRLFSEKYQNG